MRKMGEGTLLAQTKQSINLSPMFYIKTCKWSPTSVLPKALETESTVSDEEFLSAEEGPVRRQKWLRGFGGE